MSGEMFVWDQLKKRLTGRDRQIDWFWALGFLLAAILLFSINLGYLPLRDWDEAIVGQVAREMTRSRLNWLYPQMVGNVPYFNKPPLVHWLIAFSYTLGGVNEWTTRLIPALLTAFSVPLLYGVSRELFAQRIGAIFTTCVYLTLLPVVRHGRLAMLDGAVVFFFLLLLWCLLRSRRDLRYALGAGIALGLLSLTKGIFLGVLLGAIALLFILWDTPRLLTSIYLWLGIGLGMFPVGLWYLAQWQHYGLLFINTNLKQESWRRIWEQVGGHQEGVWYYFLEILKYPWPWQFFWLQGLGLAWENRNFAWGKLVLLWTSIYLVAISLMSTKLPWYILPIYPAFSLAVGAYLAQVWCSREQDSDWVVEGEKTITPFSFPRYLWWFLALIAIVGWVGVIYFSGIIQTRQLMSPKEPDLQLLLGAVAMTMTIAAVLLYRRDRQFIIILFWGCYVSLLVFMTSDNWIWELAENYPVKPVAEIVKSSTQAHQVVLTSYPGTRPSLDFYSDRRVISVSPEKMKEDWVNDPSPYFLLDHPTLENSNFPNAKVLKTTGGWNVVTKNR